jgi:carbon-monoxide dehydrogenase small subunit
LRVNFYLNGQALVVDIAATTRLIDVLRDDLQVTSVKEGCGIGECGACTILVNGDAVNACLVLVGQLEGANVETVEGLSKNGDLHPLQEAFIEHGAVHCGYCTPGMIMSAVAVLRKNPHPTEEEIRAAVAGNLCRCTGYVQIIDAIQATAAEEAEA